MRAIGKMSENELDAVDLAVKRRRRELAATGLLDVPSLLRKIVAEVRLASVARKAARKSPVERAAPGVKYRNPEDPSETWTGKRGRRPAWLVKALAGGHTFSSLAVSRGKSSSRKPA